MSRMRALHADSFDHLRLFAACCVLVSHHFALSGRPEPQVLNGTLGALGVGIFFSLSGYLVTLSVQRDPHPGRFLTRRALRIVPGLAANLLFCVFVVGMLWTTLPAAQFLAHRDTWSFIGANLVFSPQFALPGVWVDAIHPAAVNGSLWTLPFEVLAYAVLAALAALAARQLRWLGPFVLGLSLAAVLLWQPPAPVVVWGNDLRQVPVFMTLFFAGATLALHGERLHEPGLLVLLLSAYVLIDDQAWRWPLTLLIVPALVIYMGRRPVPRRLAVANDCSYGMYLYAFPIQQTLINEFGGLGFWPSMALAALLTWVCARLSWALVERPALRLKPQRPAAAGSGLREHEVPARQG